MFAIPLKQSHHIDWTGPLRSYLARTYGSSSDFGSDAAALQSLRQDALGASRNSGGRDILYRYYVQLENLSLRLPVSEQGCRVLFTWKDAFGNGEISQHSIAFEKAAILFNLAATLWSIGTDSESNKVGFSSFQAAAGIYKMISENFIHAPSLDFETDTTKILCSITLGHAQALFILNSMEKAPSSLLFRLAQGAYILYNEAADGLEKLYAAKFWGEKPWASQIKFIATYWNAFSHYHYALYLDATQHGLAISYMKEAKSLFTKITQQNTFKFASSKDVNAYKELATQKLRNMEKDNDLLYHENILPISGEIAHTIAAKPTDIDKIYSPEEMERIVGRELFANAVPLEVHETASLYSEELAKLSRREQEKVQVANQELSSALEYLDLPQSARILLHPEQAQDLGVPKAVEEWSHQISSSGTPSFEFPKRAQILSLLETLPETSKQESQKIKASMLHALNQDEILKRQYESIKSEIKELEDPSILHMYFSKPQENNLIDLVDNDRSKIDLELEKVLDTCETLRKVEKERGIVFNELKQQLISDDISSQLVANRKIMKAQAIFEKELKKFEPFVKRINSTINHQRTLLSEVTAIWKSVLRNPQIKNEATSREQHILDTTKRVDKYRNAYQTWLGLNEGVQQAQEFYTQLLAQTKQLREPNFTMSSLESSLPTLNTPPLPARGQEVSAYSVPSAFNSSLYERPPMPPPK